MALTPEQQAYLDSYLNDIRESGGKVVTRDHLLPKAQEAYDREAARLGYAPPIIIGAGSKLRLGESEPVTIGVGITTLKFDEPSHRWTEEYVRTLLKTDEALAQTPEHEDPVILAAYRKLAKQAGIDPVPKLISTAFYGEAEAGVTQGGQLYISIDRNMPIEEVIPTLAHELGHIKRGHSSIAAIVLAHNDHAQAHAQEFDADRVAVQLCQGEGLADSFRIPLSRRKQNAAYYKMPLEEYELQADPLHPPLAARIERIRSEIVRVVGNGSCPVPEGPKPVPNARPDSDKEVWR